MNKTIRTALIAAAVLPASVMTVLPASAAPAHPEARSITSVADRGHTPFRIRAGKIYDVTSHLNGVRRGDRLALESRYRGAWHKTGSWALHAGKHDFRGRARTSHPGLYTLRVQIQRHGHLLSGSASNTFEVRVLAFHTPSAHRSTGGNTTDVTKGVTESAADDSTLTNWTSPQCGVGNDGGIIGLGTLLRVPSPVSRLNWTGEVNQVLWVRDALPGGYYGSWYIAQTDEQYLHPADPNIITVTGAGDIKDSSYLDDLYVNYQPQDEYHQIAWNLQYQLADGTWTYISPSAYEPAAYQQWNQRGNSYSQSSYCMTYQNGGQ